MIEKHLLNIAAIAQKHHAVLEEKRRVTVQKQEEERDLADRQSIFMDKLKAIRQQIVEYRNGLIPILDKMAIDIRTESWEHTSLILRAGNRYKTQIILGITPKESQMFQPWRCCGFFAILGNFSKNEIDIYEYSDEINRKDYEDAVLKRTKFENQAQHLVNMSIDHFDFDMVKHFIVDYLVKELEYLKLAYPSLKPLTFNKSTLWETQSISTAKPKTKSKSVPENITKQSKSKISSPIWTPISAGIKYVSGLFSRPKRK